MGNKDKKLGDALEIGSVALVGGAGAVIPSLVAVTPPAVLVFAIGGAAAGIIQGIPKIREMFADSNSKMKLQWTTDAKSELLEECLKQVADKHGEAGLIGYKNNAWEALKDYSLNASDILENGLDLQAEIESVFNQWKESAEIEYPYTDDEVSIMKEIIGSYIYSLLLLETRNADNHVLHILITGEIYSKMKQLKPDLIAYVDGMVAEIMEKLSEPEKKKIKKRELYYQLQVDEFEKAEQTFLGNESLKDSYIEPRASIKDAIFLKDVVKDFYMQTEYGVLLLFGQPGDGKTSFCKKMVYDYAVNNPERGIDAKVLQFPLNQAKSRIINFSDGNIDIAKAFRIEGESDTLLDLDDCEGKLIILDGYDEVQYLLCQHTDYDTFKKFREYLLEIAQRYKIHFVVTSRMNAIPDNELFKNKLSLGLVYTSDKIVNGSEIIYKPDFLLSTDMNLACDFAPLSYDEQKKWCIQRKPELWKKLDKICIGNNLTESEKSIYELIQIPFIFRMVVEHEYSISEKVKNRAGLFEDLFKKTMERANHHIKEKEQFDSIKLNEEYMKLAFRIWCNDENSADILIDDDILSDKENIKKKRTLNQILKLAYYIQEDKESGRLCFMHKSFYEYYLALFLFDKYSQCNSEEKVREFFSYLAERRISFDILELLEEISENHGDISDKIDEDIVRHVVDETDFIGLDTEMHKGKESNGDYRKYDRCNNIFCNFLGILTATGNRDFSSCIFSKYHSKYLCKKLRIGQKNRIKFHLPKYLYNTDLSDAFLDNIVSGKSCFMQVDLSKCSLKKAEIPSAKFYNCGLKYTNLQDAKIQHAMICQENLQWCCSIGTDMSSSSLFDCIFENCTMDNVIFNSSNINDSKFLSTKLAGADFADTLLENVTFEMCNLCNSHFERAILIDVTFNKGELDGSYFPEDYKEHLEKQLEPEQIGKIHFV